MRILITGASGLLGSTLQPALAAAGHQCIPLFRGAARSNAAHWNPDRGEINLSPALPIDAVIHLAGANIATRWTPAKKGVIRSSRVEATQLLCRALDRLPAPPARILAASGVGFYGDRGLEQLDERDHKGSGFLADLCEAWENATREAGAIPVAHLRTGVVLTRRGGALARMLPAFRLGLGGKLGTGQQVWSWISLNDYVRVILWLLESPVPVSGPVNVVSPGAVSNDEFTRVLGSTLQRPAMFSVPAPLLRVIFGEMADEVLLASAHVIPWVLQQHGFEFQDQNLQQVLQSELGR